MPASRYARILELDATDVPAMIKLGVVRVRTGQPAEGMRLFQSAIERDPKNSDALLYLAGALASGGRSAEALPYFERAVAADPRSTMALNGLGLTRLALGDKTRAGAALRESLRIDPSQREIAQQAPGTPRRQLIEGPARMANIYRIALYPGDGIGPEVVDATCAVLDAAEPSLGGFHLEYQRFDWGMAYYDRHGRGRARRLSRRRFAASTRFFSAPSAGRRACRITSRWRR